MCDDKHPQAFRIDMSEKWPVMMEPDDVRAWAERVQCPPGAPGRFYHACKEVITAHEPVKGAWRWAEKQMETPGVVLSRFCGEGRMWVRRSLTVPLDNEGHVYEWDWPDGKGRRTHKWLATECDRMDREATDWRIEPPEPTVPPGMEGCVRCEITTPRGHAVFQTPDDNWWDIDSAIGFRHPYEFAGFEYAPELDQCPAISRYPINGHKQPYAFPVAVWFREVSNE